MNDDHPSQEPAAPETDRRSDHLLSQDDFLDASPAWGLPRSVPPTSCPPGVTPAPDDPYAAALGSLRLAPPPRFDERPETRSTTPPAG
jgi:hypothetical protein